MTHLAMSRRGGKASSAVKTKANRAKAATFWKAVRSGATPAPRRSRKPPAPEIIAQRLAPLCRKVGITKLEIFGSVARGEHRKGSDVDLIATFRRALGLRFFSLEDEMAELLGVPVHLLTRDSVERMTNPIRRPLILQDARIIYHA